MIKDDAKKIIKYTLEQVISLGDLDANLGIRYDELAVILNLKDENYCRVCCQYLDDLHYIHILDNDNGTRLVHLKAKGIDFLEST